jgi:hypothetical protein
MSASDWEHFSFAVAAKFQFPPLVSDDTNGPCYWRRWNKSVLTQLSSLTATAQKIVQYSQSAVFWDYDHILSALSQVL